MLVWGRRCLPHWRLDLCFNSVGVGVPGGGEDTSGMESIKQRCAEERMTAKVEKEEEGH